MIHAYTRVSIPTQRADLQTDEILRFLSQSNRAPDQWVHEVVPLSLPWRQRKLAVVIEALGPGDYLAVVSFDRLDRDRDKLLDIIEAVRCRGAYLLVSPDYADVAMPREMMAAIKSIAKPLDPQ
jgi:DNA invertase Pin-like site-specific DNA recombinase